MTRRSDRSNRRLARPERSLLRTCLVSLCALWALPVPAQETQKRAGWSVDFGDTKCSLTRTAGPEAATIFQLEMTAGSEVPSLLIGNPVWKEDLVQGEEPAELVLTPAGTRLQVRAFPLSGPFRRAHGIALYRAEGDVLDALSMATGMIVEVGGRKLIELAFPGAAAAVKTLRECNDSLLKSLGVDPIVTASLRKRPKPVGGNVAQWVRNDDYPQDAIRRGASGMSVVRLTISTQGRVEDCAVAHSSGDVSLDRQTCSVIQRRGRFEPAIGADGKPVAAQMITSLRWAIATG